MDNKAFIKYLEERIAYEQEHEYDVPSKFCNTDAERIAWKEGYIKALKNILFTFDIQEVEMFTHFEYTSGANPYISFSEDKAQQIIRKWKRRKIQVEKIGNNHYLIHDKQEGEK